MNSQQNNFLTSESCYCGCYCGNHGWYPTRQRGDMMSFNTRLEQTTPALRHMITTSIPIPRQEEEETVFSIKSQFSGRDKNCCQWQLQLCITVGVRCHQLWGSCMHGGYWQEVWRVSQGDQHWRLLYNKGGYTSNLDSMARTLWAGTGAWHSALTLGLGLTLGPTLNWDWTWQWDLTLWHSNCGWH